MKPYPDSWPKPNPMQPDAVPSRVSDIQKLNLYNRQLKTKDLAALMGVNPSWISTLFPGRSPLPNKQALVRARMIRRRALALEALHQRMSISEAARQVNVSYSTMYRMVQIVKNEKRET